MEFLLDRFMLSSDPVSSSPFILSSSCANLNVMDIAYDESTIKSAYGIQPRFFPSL
jgi:hypothetical protein